MLKKTETGKLGKSEDRGGGGGRVITRTTPAGDEWVG